MSHIHLTKDDIIGSHPWKGDIDLLNIIMIGLSRELPNHDETYELHRLLGALLSKELSTDEKLSIIGKEYEIPVENDIRKDVDTMCNLSQGIKEDGIAIGETRGIAIGEASIIFKMHEKGFTPEQISDATDKSVEEINTILQDASALV